MSLDSQERIFEILRHRGHISAAGKRVVLGFMEQWGVDAFKAVIETHLVEESKIAEILSEEFKLPRLMRVRILNVESEVFDFIPYELALEHLAFPFELKSDGTLLVVFADPSNPDRIKSLEVVSGKKIAAYVGERSEIISAIQRHYPISKQLPGLLSANFSERGL
jgi:hypothetical protein